MSDFIFTEDGLDDYIYWQTQDKKTLRKINGLLKAIKPEPLKGESGKWSRRINDKDRLVYSYEHDAITIYQCKGHYDDE